MKHNETASSRLFLDRPLSDTVVSTEQQSLENKAPLFDLTGDERGELLDGLLQMFLAVCLLSSFVVCGWELGNTTPSSNGATPAIAQQAHPEACEVSAKPQPSAMPHTVGALTAKASLF